MPSKVKILPSDVLLLIIDYLDSPTMMNCREVCKDWLDVVDGNRSLWDYFYDPKESHRATTMRMLEIFSSRSNHTIKAFEIHVDPSAKPLEKKKKKSEESAQIIQTLLQSNRSLRVWSNQTESWDFKFVSLFLEGLDKFQTLRSFCGVDRSGLQISSRFRTYQSSANPTALPNGSIPSLFRFLSDFGVGTSSLWALQASTANVVHLKSMYFLDDMTELNFPRLQILELSNYTDKFNKEWFSPNLKLLSVGLGGSGFEPLKLVNHFPSSIEEIWLVASYPEVLMANLSERGLSSLKRHYPKVEKLRFDSNVTFIPAEVISMVQARKEAFKKGFKVEGVQLKPIKTLTLDFERLQPAQLSWLQKLVPEVIDAGTASKEVVVDC